jgi:hypothetical protein
MNITCPTVEALARRICMHTVTRLLKARSVKPAETAVARKRLCTLSVLWLRDATIKELLGEVFYVWSVPKLHKESIVSCEFGSWKPISSAREQLRKGASQRGQEPLDAEPEDATLLEAATKQRGENRDWEHWSVW